MSERFSVKGTPAFSEKFSEKAVHLLLALLLCVGLLIPALHILLPGQPALPSLLLSALILLLLEAVSVTRLSALIASGLCLGLLGFWCLALGGVAWLSDLFIALSLHFTGQRAALPLMASEVSTALALVIGAVSWFATARKATYLPALVLCAAALMLVWLTGQSSLTPWLLFALAAVLLLLIRDRHEHSPLLRIFPWLALPLLLAFLIAPKDGLVIAPLKEKADELRQMVLDRLFFTEPRDVFSLSAEGYYPQGSGQLGGKPELSDHPVLQVSAPRTVYLRGVVLNEYNGHAWRNTTGGRRYLWQSGALSRNRVRLFDQELPSLSSENTLTAPSGVSVRMLSESASTLFVPQRIRELTPGGGLVPYYSNSSELFATRNLQPGDTWSVSAPLFLAGDPGLGTLIDASSAFTDASWSSILETYTALPDHLEQPVFALAREIASAAATPYEKALTIQSWLSRNCRYTLEVEDHPANVDFVTRFLMETREGYCTYFASAMTVLCRMAGLPARYVEGYAADPDENGQAVVTGLNAHAWTEVCFEGFGWLTFDATPRQHRSGAGNGQGSPDPTPTPEPPPAEEPTQEPTETPSEEPTLPPEGAASAGEDTPTPSPAQASPPEPTPDPDTAPTETPASPSEAPPEEDGRNEPPQEQEPFSFPWLLILLAIFLLALGLRVYLTSPRYLEKKAGTESARFRVWAQELGDLLAADRQTRRTGETLMAFTRRLDREDRYSLSLSPAGECLSLIHYGAVRPLPEDTALLRESAQGLRRELSRTSRLRFWLRRLFLPLRKRDYAKR